MGVNYNSRIVTDGLVLCLDAANSKSYNQAENMLTYSAATTANWTEVTSNTTVANLSLNALGLFNGVLVTSNLGYNWHRIGTGFVFSITSGETYTATFYYRKGSSDYARLQIRCNNLESLVEGPANGSSWVTTTSIGAISNITTTLMSDGLTYRTCFTLVSSQTGTASLAIGIGLGDNIPGKTIIALGGQVTKKIGPSTYTPTTGTAVTQTNILYDLVKLNNATGTTVSTAYDTPGCVINLDRSTEITCTFATPINKYNFTLCYWGRPTATPDSDYQRIMALVDSVNPHGYYFNMDTRQVTNAYVLHYVKDFSTSNWDTRQMISQAQYNEYKWGYYTLVMKAENLWQSYYNGQFLGTNTTPSQDLSSYGNITSLILGTGTNFRVASVQMYNKQLTADEIFNNFNAMRGRFGI